MRFRKLQLALIVLSTLVIGSAYAEYTMKSYTINNGASKIMKGDGYEMQSSIGQVDGSQIMSKDNYQLNGGFWHENTDLIFKNDFE